MRQNIKLLPHTEASCVYSENRAHPVWTAWTVEISFVTIIYFILQTLFFFLSLSLGLKKDFASWSLGEHKGSSNSISFVSFDSFSSVLLEQTFWISEPDDVYPLLQKELETKQLMCKCVDNSNRSKHTTLECWQMKVDPVISEDVWRERFCGIRMHAHTATHTHTHSVNSSHQLI